MEVYSPSVHRWAPCSLNFPRMFLTPYLLTADTFNHWVNKARKTLSFVGQGKSAMFTITNGINLTTEIWFHFISLLKPSIKEERSSGEATQ